jgi:hypothetical protein
MSSIPPWRNTPHYVRILKYVQCKHWTEYVDYSPVVVNEQNDRSDRWNAYLTYLLKQRKTLHNGVELRLGPFGTSATSGLLYLSRVIVKKENLVE